jgi:hypothetical protein
MRFTYYDFNPFAVTTFSVPSPSLLSVHIADLELEQTGRMKLNSNQSSRYFLTKIEHRIPCASTSRFKASLWVGSSQKS